ncbi:MAG: hypothetical protein HY924_04180 [Elusimicrobia bacterium]|nr:hypothetical protein [Elusimicrobiota bacterium]
MTLPAGGLAGLRRLIRRRLALFVAVDAGLLVVGLLLLFLLLQRGSDAGQMEANERETAVFIKGWTADGTSLSARKMTILLSDCVDNDRILDLPRGFAPLGRLGWLLRRAGVLSGPRYAELFEGPVSVPAWSLETRGLGVRRDDMVAALSSQIMMIIEAHGSVDLVVQGEVADVALAAARSVEKLAPRESRVLVRKVVVLGASAAGAAGFEKPGRVREWVYFWTEPGKDTEPVLRARAFTRRFKGEDFDGDDLLFTAPPKEGRYSDKEIAVFVQRLLQSDLSMEDYMMLAQRRPPPAEAFPEGGGGAWPSNPPGRPGPPALTAPPAASVPAAAQAPAVQPLASFMPFPVLSTGAVRDSSTLVIAAPAAVEPAAPEPEAPKTLKVHDLTVEQPLRLVERSVRLAADLAKRNAERAESARRRKKERMTDYTAAQAAQLQASQAAAQAPAPTAVQAAAAPPPAAAEAPLPALPAKGSLSPFKSGPKVTRQDLGEEP